MSQEGIDGIYSYQTTARRNQGRKRDKLWILVTNRKYQAYRRYKYRGPSLLALSKTCHLDTDDRPRRARNTPDRNPWGGDRIRQYWCFLIR